MDIRQPADNTEHRGALELLVGRPGLPPSVMDQRVEALQMYVRLRGMSLDHCLVAAEGSRLMAACLCLDSPGRLSSVVLSPGSHLPETLPAAVGLLQSAERHADSRNIQLLQGMVAPEARSEEQVYAKAGFRHLAELLYLEGEVTAKSPGLEPPVTMSWRTYSPEAHDLFAHVIEGTYEGSLDCGSLNGVRSIEDVLASHRATGQFDPRFWRVATVGAMPVGVILLAYMPENPSLEVVYMGLLPSARGRGHGQGLMQHAFNLARDEAVPCLTLSVDEKNVPARRLYQRFGFVELTRRHVWVRIVGNQKMADRGDLHT